MQLKPVSDLRHCEPRMIGDGLERHHDFVAFSHGQVGPTVPEVVEALPLGEGVQPPPRHPPHEAKFCGYYASYRLNRL